ncbi:MAG: phosphoribosylglycinamide formyltransferase [Elusimicrobia bacterium]|nr:phosphoribosylglycinamide formyltransferase [Elusimicrobiota bacterium]
MSSDLRRFRIGVLASGNGSNFQAILEAVRSDRVQGAEVAVVISSRSGAGVLRRAEAAQIPREVVAVEDFPGASEHCSRLAGAFRSYEVDLVCLAGYFRRLEPCFLKAFPDRVLNIHPALLPRFGGEGMYGRRVHEAVLASGEKESGATVHFVDEEYDHGETVLERRVPVLSGDTPETLARRVLEVEHQIYPEAIQKVLRRLREQGRAVG